MLKLQHLTFALAAVTDAVIITNRDDRITYVNAAAEQVTQLIAADALGERLSEVFAIVDTNTGGSIDEALDAAKLSEESSKNLRRAVVLGGADTPIIIEYSVSAMRDPEGRFLGSTTVFRDIMRRRASELALEASEETLLANAAALFEEKARAHVTLNSIGDAVISTDFRGRITFMNVIAEKMTGWSLSEAVGRPLDEILFLVDSTTREQVKSPAMRAIIENRAVSLETARTLIGKDGIELAVEDTASPIHDHSGCVVGAVMVAHDVTVAREQALRFARMALYDNLTGLPNRTLLEDRLGQALERAHRIGSVVALLFIDLDRFKPINDLQGHAMGDQLLKLVASRLQACVRSSDTVSRYGGDEFVIMLSDIAHPQDAAKCAEKALALISTPFQINGLSLQIGASIGIARCPGNATDTSTLVKCADVAMYRAKSNGRNQYIFFDEEPPVS